MHPWAPPPRVWPSPQCPLARPPTRKGPQITMALGRLAPDALQLADPDGAGGAQAVALVT